MKARIQRHILPIALLLSTFGIYFTTLFWRMIQMRSDGLYVGHDHVWADWPLHIAIAQIFATKDPANWFHHHPMYAYGKFTYSFVTDFISGMLMRTGLTLELSFILPSIAFSLLLILGMYFLLFLATGRRKTAVIAITLFFLSSGFGFVQYIADVLKAGDIHTALYPLKHYSRIDQYSWYSGNYIVGMLVPQRAFLLGMTLSVWSLSALLYVLRKKQRNQITIKDKILLIIAGLLTGLLPIAHAHSFIAMIVIAGAICISQIKNWKTLLFYVIPAALLSTILYLIFIAGGIENKHFISLLLGFTAKGNSVAWVVMWIRVWGLTLPIALLGYFLVNKKDLLQKSFYWSFGILFLIANTILFQPIEWDNAKLFLWSYFGFSIMAALCITNLSEKNVSLTALNLPRSGLTNRTSPRVIIRGTWIAAVLLLVLTATGITELLRLQHIKENAYQIISNEDMQIANTVRQNTDQNAVFLTTTATNHWAMMWAARPIMMGFVGWVNNFGFLYSERLDDMHTMYQGNEKSKQLLQKYKISYVVIGPGELLDFKANQQFYNQNFPVAFQSSNTKVYDVR